MGAWPSRSQGQLVAWSATVCHCMTSNGRERACDEESITGWFAVQWLQVVISVITLTHSLTYLLVRRWLIDLSKLPMLAHFWSTNWSTLSVCNIEEVPLTSFLIMSSLQCRGSPAWLGPRVSCLCCGCPSIRSHPLSVDWDRLQGLGQLVCLGIER